MGEAPIPFSSSNSRSLKHSPHLQNVEMHTYNLPPATSAPSSPTSANATLERETPSLLDNISDTLLNAFAKVRKPDERFVKMKADIDAWEESMGGFERGEGKLRSRMGGESAYPLSFSLIRPFVLCGERELRKNRGADLSSDYDDFAGSIQGLGFLESGITDALKQFELSLLDFSNTLKDSVSPFSSSPSLPMLLNGSPTGPYPCNAAAIDDDRTTAVPPPLHAVLLHPIQTSPKTPRSEATRL